MVTSVDSADHTFIAHPPSMKEIPSANPAVSQPAPPNNSSTQQPATSSVNGTSEPWSVQSALSQIPSSLLPALSPAPSTPVPFFHLIERLKTTPRTGWARFGVPDSESIADHMYRMSIILMCAPASLSSKLDMSRCLRLALVHDMAESLVGDITPKDNVSKPEKARRERETMQFFERDVLSGFDGGGQGRALRELWEEYEAAETGEAKLVKDVDKLELLLQMVEYEKSGGGRRNLGEFKWVERNIESEECKEWSREVMREREEFWKKVEREVNAPEMNGSDGVEPEQNGVKEGGEESVAADVGSAA